MSLLLLQGGGGGGENEWIPAEKDGGSPGSKDLHEEGIGGGPDIGGVGGCGVGEGVGGGGRTAQRPVVVEREGMGVYAEKEGTIKKRRRGVGFGEYGGPKEASGVEEGGPSPLTHLSPEPVPQPAPRRRRRSPLWQPPGTGPGY